MTLIFYIIYGIWIMSEVLINRLFKSKSSDRQDLDKNTVGIIWIAIVVACTLAVLIASYFYIPIVNNVQVRLVGLFLILLGCVLRIFTIVSLGKEFTSDVTIRQNHQLKTSGFYRYVRHPSYSFSLLSFIGFGLSLNNWVSLLLIVPIIFIVFIRRIRVEESALVTQFGDQYTDFMNRTSRLIPFIY